MPVVLLIIFSIPLLSLAWWIWADRRLKALGCGSTPRILLSLAVLVPLAGFTWVILARQGIVSAGVPSQLYAIVLLWGLIFLPALGIPTMLIWSGWALGKAVVGKKKTAPVDEAEGWSRRKVLGTLATSLPILATFGATGYSLSHLSRFRIRELTLTLKDLPEALDGVRIAHLTDTHVGKFTKGKVLEEIINVTNRLEADLVLFTGDLIDNSILDLPAAVNMLQRLKAKSGVFVIEGNHDLFEDPKGFEKGIRDGGISMLRNESMTVQINGTNVQLMGIVWNRGEEEIADDVDQVWSQKQAGAFPILLAHHPHAFDRAAERGIPLTFAGHTHGGQLMLNEKIGGGPAMFRYWSGLYERNGSALVVGNGTGNWFPLRVNAPAEIIHLTLKRA